jgi:hypothetical protein
VSAQTCDELLQIMCSNPDEKISSWRNSLSKFFWMSQDDVSRYLKTCGLIEFDEFGQESEKCAVNALREMRQVVKSGRICVDSIRQSMQVSYLKLS